MALWAAAIYPHSTVEKWWHCRTHFFKASVCSCTYHSELATLQAVFLSLRLAVFWHKDSCSHEMNELVSHTWNKLSETNSEYLQCTIIHILHRYTTVRVFEVWNLNRTQVNGQLSWLEIKLWHGSMELFPIVLKARSSTLPCFSF